MGSFFQAETYEIDPTKATHGSDGPLKVSYGGPGALSEVGKQLLDIGPKMNKKRPAGDEGNAFDEASINTFYVSFHPCIICSQSR